MSWFGSSSKNGKETGVNFRINTGSEGSDSLPKRETTEQSPGVTVAFY